MKLKHLFIGLLAVTLASCGGSEAPKTETAPAESMIETEAPAETPAEEVDENAVVLEIAGDDAMKFDKKELRVKEGQEVTVVLTHTGKMAKAAMGHNFVVLAAGTDMAEYATEAMQSPDTDYVIEGDQVIAHTSTIGGGETTKVTFTAPAAGTYKFLCTFPGHYAMMNGDFIVE